MAKKANITIKPGDDIIWSGVITRTSVTSWAGYVLKAEFRAKNPNSKTPNTLMGSASIVWVNTATGAFRLTVPRSVTKKWGSGITMLMDISVMNTEGKRVRSETAEFMTEAGVTEAE